MRKSFGKIGVLFAAGLMLSACSSSSESTTTTTAEQTTTVTAETTVTDTTEEVGNDFGNLIISGKYETADIDVYFKDGEAVNPNNGNIEPASVATFVIKNKGC